MADSASLLRHSQLLNRLVLDRQTTEALGRIETVWMHPPAHRVMGFICKPGFMSKQRYAFNLKQLYRLGTESILVSSRAAETTLKEVRLLETLMGHEVWTDAGENLGRIVDCLFDRKTGSITHYLLKSGGWRGFTSGIYQLSPLAIMSFGSRRILVTASASENLPLFQEGLEERIAQTSDRIKSGYTQELESLTSRAHKLTQQAEEQLQKLTQQTSQKVDSFTQQANHKSENWGQQVQQGSQKWVQQAKHQGRTLWERVEDGAFNLTEDWSNPLPSEDGRQGYPPEANRDLEQLTQDQTVIKNIPLEDLEDDQPWI
ncbi:MAG: photosystem reaction center subunit H [Acaryochloris sp. SU_5_25]|nr:photosystem reaction center subunit H [Acaryochloris sp. SU_5_25]